MDWIQSAIAVFNWVIASGPNLVAAVSAVVVGLIGLFLLIPGEQPEKALQAVVDFLAKYSKK